MELQENVMAFKSAAKIILSWDKKKLPPLSRSPGERTIFAVDRAEIDRYLQALDDIQRQMKPGKVLDYQSDGADLIQIAMARLQFEFLNILTRHNTDISTSQSSTAYLSSQSISVSCDIQDDDYMIYGVLFDKEVDDLRSIAKRMNSAEHLIECVQIYGRSRKVIVNASFKRLSTYKLGGNDIKKLGWVELQMRIELMIRAAKWGRFLFSREMRFYEQIFDGHRSASRDVCFIEETYKEVEMWLFEFAEAVSTTRRSPQKLFKILDLYNVLLPLLGDMNEIFHSRSSSRFQVAGNRILPPLVKLVKGIVSEFGNSLLDEQSNAPVPTGTIHPLTSYVTKYISGIVNYKETLINLNVSFKPSTSSKHVDHMGFAKVEGQTLQLTWIFTNLISNLEGKSNRYEDASLGHLFMMNNVCHIVQTIEESRELQEMIGDDYLNKLREKVLQIANSYVQSTWDRVLNCLGDKGLHYKFCSYRWLKKDVVRKRYKNFHAMFEEVCQSQSTWLVANVQLRNQLHESILEKLIPAYESFLGQFKSYIESGKHSQKYIKYSKDDLKNVIYDFFVENKLPGRTHG